MASVKEVTGSNFSNLMSKCPIQNCEQLLHQLINTFCGQKPPSYEIYSEIWDLCEWWDLIKESEAYFSNLGAKDHEASKKLSLPDEYKTIISKALNIRSKDIKNSLLEKSHSISGAHLKNFDWKLQITLGSDKIAQINEPRLLLNLNIEDKGKPAPLNLDLSMDELKYFITSLEEANKEVTTLKSSNPEDISFP